jgi:TatD DNase family protein
LRVQTKQPRMIDTHCHLDLYPDPSGVAAEAERQDVFTVCVTNLPSAYERSRPHIRERRGIRLALGLHPLLAQQHAGERERFRALVPDTSFVGEVGLDFSSEGRQTANIQVDSFEFVLHTLGDKPKFVTVHSRRAEARVVELLRAARRSPVVFHWYSGPLKILEHAVADGHYFSINPAMVRSPNGRKIIAAIPRERILTETDGPFVLIEKRAAEPPDVAGVEQALAQMWEVSPLHVRSVVAENFKTMMVPMRRSP